LRDKALLCRQAVALGETITKGQNSLRLQRACYEQKNDQYSIA